MPQEPKVSIIIVNWNGKHFLGKCLFSLFRQTYKNFEVIVVDNASTDGSVEYLQRRFPQVKVLRNSTNVGFAAANNQTISISQGKYILLLNNDVILPKDTLAKLVEQFDIERDGALNPLQFSWERKFISAGFPAPWVAKLLALFVRIKGEHPFYPCLACCLTTKEILQKFPLNEKLFFFEDTEWGWRLLLMGLKTRVVEDALFYHKYSGTVKNTPEEAFVCGKVAVATYYVCLKLIIFFLFIPVLFLGYYVPRLVKYYARPKLFTKFLAGLVDFLRNIFWFSQYRQTIQKTRKIDDWQIIKEMIQSIDYDRRTRMKYAEHFIS